MSLPLRGTPGSILRGFALLCAMALAAPLAGRLVAQSQSPIAPSVSLLSFEELVGGASLVAVTKVTDRKSEWEYYGASRLIVTKVTLQIEQVLKGSGSGSITVEVLGGTIGDETLGVSHVPDFRAGDHDVLFLNGKPRSVSPLVGSDQGRFRIVQDPATGDLRVLTAGWRPLRSIAEIATAPSSLITSMSAALNLKPAPKRATTPGHGEGNACSS